MHASAIIAHNAFSWNAFLEGACLSPNCGMVSAFCARRPPGVPLPQPNPGVQRNPALRPPHQKMAGSVYYPTDGGPNSSFSVGRMTCLPEEANDTRRLRPPIRWAARLPGLLGNLNCGARTKSSLGCSTTE
jgi:hypothetical protein